MNIGDRVRIKRDLQKNLTEQREVFLGMAGIVTGISDYGVTLSVSGDLLMWDPDDLEILPNRRRLRRRNLSWILKGHEGEKFYSPAYGDISVIKVEGETITIETPDSTTVKISRDGKFLGSDKNSECMIFPSKDQRNWEKWAREQKTKTWGDITRTALNENISLDNDIKLIREIKNSPYYFDTPIKRSILAFYKIRQLIEIGYGGNITSAEWNRETPKYCIKYVSGKFMVSTQYSQVSLIAFHSIQEAEDFLSRQENIRLLENLYMK